MQKGLSFSHNKQLQWETLIGIVDSNFTKPR